MNCCVCVQETNESFFFLYVREILYSNIQVNELFFVCEPTKDFIFLFSKNNGKQNRVQDWWFLYACFYNC